MNVFNFMNMDAIGNLTSKSLPMPESHEPLEWKLVGDYEWASGDYRVTVFMSSHEWIHEQTGDYGRGVDIEDAKRQAAIHAAAISLTTIRQRRM